MELNKKELSQCESALKHYFESSETKEVENYVVDELYEQLRGLEDQYGDYAIGKVIIKWLLAGNMPEEYFSLKNLTSRVKSIHFSNDNEDLVCGCGKETDNLYTINEWCEIYGINNEKKINYLYELADKENLDSDMCEDCFESILQQCE